ncbi:MAG: hypothetical protein V4649_08555 [Bacteroidota bacterium]
MNEISYYEEFAQKFKQYLISYLGNEYVVAYSCNNTLNVLINNIEAEISITISPVNLYIPKLKVDIVFAVVDRHKVVKFILIEAKFLNQLSLKDYSQLVGYLQVAKFIDSGLLLLIQKGNSINKLSNEFQEIIRLQKLPMDWIMDLRKINEKCVFKTGIISYLPNNGIDWVDTEDINGISSFESLAKYLIGI